MCCSVSFYVMLWFLFCHGYFLIAFSICSSNRSLAYFLDRRLSSSASFTLFWVVLGPSFVKRGRVVRVLIRNHFSHPDFWWNSQLLTRSLAAYYSGVWHLFREQLLPFISVTCLYDSMFTYISSFFFSPWVCIYFWNYSLDSFLGVCLLSLCFSWYRSLNKVSYSWERPSCRRLGTLSNSDACASALAI